MNPRALFLAVAGAFVLCQVLAGDALGRLRVLDSTPGAGGGGILAVPGKVAAGAAAGAEGGAAAGGALGPVGGIVGKVGGGVLGGILGAGK